MTTNTMTVLDAASRAAEDADQRVEDVRAAILGGDSKIKPGALESAEADARLAHLRVESLHLSVADQSEQERHNAIQAVREEIEAAIDDPEPYVAALRAVENAAIAWIELNEARAVRIRTWRKQLRDLGIGEIRRGDTPAESGIAPLLSNYGGLDIRIDTGHVGAIDAGAYLTALTTLPTAAILNPARRPEDIYARLARELGHIPT